MRKDLNPIFVNPNRVNPDAGGANARNMAHGGQMLGTHGYDVDNRPADARDDDPVGQRPFMGSGKVKRGGGAKPSGGDCGSELWGERDALSSGALLRGVGVDHFSGGDAIHGAERGLLADAIVHCADADKRVHLYRECERLRAAATKAGNSTHRIDAIAEALGF